MTQFHGFPGHRKNQTHIVLAAEAAKDLDEKDEHNLMELLVFLRGGKLALNA
jgi:ABC-type lipoprotein export system ATPase subunit